jgi:serine/threonine-protein kinase
VLCHTKEISGSPFFNIFSTMRISAFSRPEAEALVRVPSARSGRPLEKLTRQILDLSGLFPFYIQMACSHTLEYLDEHPKEQPDFVEIRHRFKEEVWLHYQYLWDHLDSHERETMSRVAESKPIPDSLRHVVDELATRRYVLTEGTPRLFASTFEEFVREQSKRGRSDPPWKRLFRRSGSER